MSGLYHIADLHWGHKNILKYRTGFDSIEQHDHTILDNILNTTTKRDSLWLLGDILFDRKSIEYMRIISNHVGQLNWVLGNHDTDNKERLETVQQVMDEGLCARIGAIFKRGGYWLTHAPLHPLELRGCKNIHGHVHSATIEDENYYNVSCENVRYKPVSREGLLTLDQTIWTSDNNNNNNVEFMKEVK